MLTRDNCDDFLTFNTLAEASMKMLSLQDKLAHNGKYIKRLNIEKSGGLYYLCLLYFNY